MFGCNTDNNSVNFDSEISFHTFPTNNPKQLKHWIYLCRRKDVFNTKYARICSKHFKVDDFIPPNPIYAQHGFKPKRQVNRTCSPSLFLPMQKEPNESTPRIIRSQKRASRYDIQFCDKL